MGLVHLDSDFLVYASSGPGPERDRLLELSRSSTAIQMSAVAWYEYARGPRIPEELALARYFLAEEGIVPFSDELAGRASDVFRSLGSPRRRANDIAIGVTASVTGATLLTRNARDFAGIPGLRLEAV